MKRRILLNSSFLFRCMMGYINVGHGTTFLSVLKIMNIIKKRSIPIGMPRLML